MMGEGIARERQEAIFRPFEQESHDTMKKHGGSGLGLPIVKNVVELMGGTITVDSTQKGKTFRLFLTVSKELLIDISVWSRCLIDDDKDTQEYGKSVLEKMGIHCDIADSGEKAIIQMEDAFKKPGL